MYRRKLPHIPIRQKIFEFFTPKVCWFKKKRYLCIAFEKQNISPKKEIQDAQMAELVDALVSNTSGFTSIPVRPRVWVHKAAVNHSIFSRFYFVG